MSLHLPTILTFHEAHRSLEIMNKKFPSIGSALSYGFNNVFSRNIFFFFGIYLIIGAILFSFGLLKNISIILGLNQYPIIEIMLSFSTIALMVFLWIGWTIIRLEWYEKETSNIKQLFAGGRFLLPMVGAAFLYLMMTSFGTILLVIPGIYLATRFYFYNYLIIDKKVGVIQAFKLSSALTKGYRFKLFLFIIVSSLLVATIIFIPVINLASMYIYKRLSKAKSESVL